MIKTFILLSRVFTLSDLPRQYPDIQTSIATDTVTGVVLETPEVPTYIGGRLGGVWPRESDPRDYQPRPNPIIPANDITPITPVSGITPTAPVSNVVTQENAIDMSMERILQAPADTFSHSFFNREHPLLGDNLASSAFSNQVNTQEFTNLLLEQLPSVLLEENVESIVRIPEAARLTNFDDIRRLQMAHIARTYLEDRGVSVPSAYINQARIPNISWYTRVLGEFIRCISNAPDMNPIIRDFSSLRMTLPVHIPENFATPVYDNTLFIFLDRTFHLNPSFLSDSITFLSGLHPIGILSFGMLFARFFNLFSDFNFRRIGGNHLEDFSIHGIYRRIRNTFSIFGALRQAASNSISLPLTNVNDNLERFNRDFQNALRNHLLSLSSNLSSRASYLFRTYLIPALIGIMGSLGFYCFRNQLAEFLREIIKIIQGEGPTPPQPPGAVTVKVPKSLIYCIAKGLASGWKEWWDSQS